MIDLSPVRQKLIETQDYVLVLGGPGSGKTTIALLKAEHEIRTGQLKRGQRILFLSFARATIARVAQQAGKLIAGSEHNILEINTYHGFAWNFLQSHGYLLNASRLIRVLPPPEAAARLAAIDPKDRLIEKRRLYSEEGLLHFDLFAATCAEVMSRSKRLATIISDTYPIIILDEFQDTNLDEWKMIQVLGQRSRLIALADAEQRIYEFRGADPKRIGEFITAYSPTQFDFGLENNRSNGTDIVEFGNDLLTGANKANIYNDVSMVRYQVRKGIGIHLDLKLAVMKGCERLRNSGKSDWSIAVLVPSKRLMIDVSDYLGQEQQFSKGKRLPSFQHEVALETTGPALAAVLIARLLERAAIKVAIVQNMIFDLCTHIRGRKGDSTPNKIELDLASALDRYLGTGAIKGKKRQQIVNECYRIAEEMLELQLSGDPGEDWLAVRRLLTNSVADAIRQVAEDAKYLRLLHRGATLRSSLSELWRTRGSYLGASSSVRDALLQEHFSASTKEWRGVYVMTIHKSKGKEFDEVFVYEGSHHGRIVRVNATPDDIAQARLALRVAVTRAMKRATIMTPIHDVCRFL